jgi:DNA-binding NarL/FixJ family response regulator
MESTMNTLLIDDHPLYRSALKIILEEICIEVNVYESDSINQALTLLDKHPKFDLVLLDLNLSDANGLKSFITISQRLSNTPVVVISANVDKRIINHTLNTGARGYIPKSSSNKEIKNALTMVLKGSVYIPSLAIQQVNGKYANSDIYTSLTNRQSDVLQLLSLGLSNKKISSNLGIAETTVRVHVSDIIQNFNVCNRTEAVLQAQMMGLVDNPF